MKIFDNYVFKIIANVGIINLPEIVIFDEINLIILDRSINRLESSNNH